MSAIKDQTSSTSIDEDEDSVETINDDHSTQNNQEDTEDIDVIQEDTEDRKPFKKHMLPDAIRSFTINQSLINNDFYAEKIREFQNIPRGAVETVRKKTNVIKNEFNAEKSKDFQSIPRQDTAIDFRKGIEW